MPRPKRRFLTMKVPTGAGSGMKTTKQQCCAVCYTEFTPFPPGGERWESAMTKMFYQVLDIPSTMGEDGEEEDSVISLPFCPQCHSKISVMNSLHNQLSHIQAQFATLRNDVAFTIVATIDKNCRNGPMDFIRQQIFTKWKSKYAVAAERGEVGQGLEGLVNSPSKVHPFHSEEGGVGEGEGEATRNGGLDSAPPTQPQNSQPSKRPARAASLGYSQYLLISQTASLAKIKRMEAMAIRESIRHEMPTLTPIQSISPPDSVVKRRGSAKSTQDNSSPRLPAKPPKVQTVKSILTGLKKEEPAKIKMGRKPRVPKSEPMESSIQDSGLEDLMGGDFGASPDPFPVKKGRRGKTSLPDSSLPESSVLPNGDFGCGLCPKVYFNISRLRRHESLCHPSTKSLQCSICPNGFSSMLAYRRHMQNQHHRSLKGTATKTCPFCKKSFVKDTAYEYHVRKHHERKVKRERKPRSGSGAEEEQEVALRHLGGVAEVDPLLITPEDTHAFLHSTPNPVPLLPDLHPPPTQAKKPKKNKIFMGGRKRRRRRNPAPGGPGGLKRLKTEGVGMEMQITGVYSLSDVKVKAVPSSSTEEGMAGLNSKGGPGVRGMKKERVTSAPTRKSTRRTDGFSVKAEHHPLSDSEDKLLYNCSVCSAQFSLLDQLTDHNATHAQVSGERENGALEPGAPVELDAMEEPEPIQVNLEEESPEPSVDQPQPLAIEGTNEEPVPPPKDTHPPDELKDPLADSPRKTSLTANGTPPELIVADPSTVSPTLRVTAANNVDVVAETREVNV